MRPISGFCLTWSLIWLCTWRAASRRFSVGRERCAAIPTCSRAVRVPCGRSASEMYWGMFTPKPTVSIPFSVKSTSSRLVTVACTSALGFHGEIPRIRSLREPCAVIGKGRVCGTGMGNAETSTTREGLTRWAMVSTAFSKRCHCRSGSAPVSSRNGLSRLSSTA